MKQRNLFFFKMFLQPVTILFVLLFTSAVSAQSLKERLMKLPDVVSVKPISADTVFAEQYEVFFKQPIDHNNPALGSFKQRVIVSHIDYKKPVVAVLEGYYIWNGKSSELQKLIKCNQINIEHRFFGKSRPENVPWDKLTIWQAATDQHIIIQELKTIYGGKWLTTGISKGGQTTLFHRSFYPDDVDASVAYVAPLNFAREDPRIYHFLDHVGKRSDRRKIRRFQKLCFENFDTLKQMLVNTAKQKNWTFQLGFDKALQYAILEYSFAFWQWGYYSPKQIPDKKATPQQLFKHLNNVSGFTFFEDHEVDKIRGFFWAALTEIGIYGYRTKPFKKYLGNVPDYTFDFTAPKGYAPVYNPQSMLKVKRFLDNDAKNILLIYGGLDTWGATAYHPSGKNNLVNMTLPKGHHTTRIRNFPESERQYMYKLINSWTGTDIKDIF